MKNFLKNPFRKPTIVVLFNNPERIIAEVRYSKNSFGRFGKVVDRLRNYSGLTIEKGNKKEF
jgi:hypothetical protein